ncbi:MAG: DNA methyltransferase, partial [Panacagrimonas sp.]
MNKTALEADLAAFGASAASVRWLDSSGADNIDYRDLIHGVSLDWERTQKISLSAVIEFDQRPLMYVIRADAMSSALDVRSTQLQALRKKLACRGDRAWLAVITPGQLSIYPVGLSTTLPPPVAISRSDKDAQLFLQDLIVGRRKDLQRGAEETSFHDLLFKLVTKASRDLLALPPFRAKPDPVLSLVGRALFARFLIDRGLMNRKSFPTFEGDFQSCFSTPDKAALACNWQDSTFNGELLPLADKSYRTYFRELHREAPEIFQVLSNILYHAPDGQLLIKETWEHVDFAHVPIGLLSEVYEQFAHEHGPFEDSDKPDAEKVDESKKKKKKKSLADLESIHYTPRAIAAYMLDQAWPALKCKPHEAHLLDPAAGGGVFLGLAYRRLVAEFWRAKKRAPTRKELRGILYRQVRGMDINEAALRLAALSLYLTALELDPSPQDFTDMAFDPMIGEDSVLVLVRKPHERHPNPHILGSLGDSVPTAFKNRFDLVVGNPPWTSWPDGAKGAGLNKAAQAEIRRIANQRASMSAVPDKLKAVAASYRNPDRVPDLAFAWKATEWAKAQDGVIALAMHARLLFKRQAHGAAARDALFSAVQVTGVLNGAALRMQEVWPNVQAPWCLIFARNRVPTIDDAFYFISPTVERKLNSAGLMRVDYESAAPVSLRALHGQPLLLKTLFRGTPADVEVMQIL